MSVKTAYISKLGADYKISDHFALWEMQCKDGSDKVLYATELLEKLEELRAYGGFTVTVNSGYRTAAYNKKIGGASASQHLYGTAADIAVKKDGVTVDAKKICCLCQTLGFKGIGYISAAAAHVDMRVSGSYRGDERRDYSSNVGNDFYRYFKIDPAAIAALKTAAAAKEEAEMNQEEFDRLLENHLARLKEKAPSAWSSEERIWAEKNRLILGDADGNKEYKDFCTREQMVVLLYRLYKKIKGE